MFSSEAEKFQSAWNDGNIMIPPSLTADMPLVDGSVCPVWPVITEAEQLTPQFVRLRFRVWPGIMTTRWLAERFDVIESIVSWRIDRSAPVVGDPNSIDVWFGTPPDFDDVLVTPARCELYGSTGDFTYLGWDRRGFDVYLPLRNVAGVLVSGLPGTGKTAIMERIAAELLGTDAIVDLIDLKHGGDYRGVLPWCRQTATNVDGAVRVLRTVAREISARTAHLAENGVANFWNIQQGARPPLLLLVVDEVQEGCVAVDQAGKRRADEFTRLLTSIVKRGRSAGVAVIVGSQKVTADSLPTGLRDMLEVRVCGRQMSAEAARAAMGSIPDEGPRPDRLPAGRPGRMILSGVGEPVEFQAAPQLSADQIYERLYGTLGCPPPRSEAAEA